MTQSYSSLWRFPIYLRLIASSFISVIGSHLTLIALPLYVYQVTVDASKMGIVFACETVPWILWGPVAGTWTDRLNRRNLLIFCETASALFMLWLAVSGRFSQICFISFCLGIINASSATAYGALLPTTLPKEMFQTGYSFYTMLMIGAKMVVPALGGVCLHFASIQSLFVMDAVSFMLSAILLSFVCVPRITATETQNTWNQLKNGVHLLWDNPDLARPLRFELVKTLAEALTFPLLVVLLVTTFKYSKEYYGYFIAASGIGSFLGTYLAGRFFKNREGIHFILVGSLILFSSYFAISFHFSFIFLILIAAVGHCGDGIRTVFVHTFFGTKTRDQDRGCVIGLINAAISTVYVIGYLLSGVFVYIVNIQTIYRGAALIAGIICLAGYFWQPTVRSDAAKGPSYAS